MDVVEAYSMLREIRIGTLQDVKFKGVEWKQCVLF